MPFDRPTLEQLIARADAELASRLTTGELAWSDRKVLARTHAGAMHGAYGYLDYLSRQIVPSAATEIEFLEDHARLWLTPARKPAAPATGTVTFTGTDTTEIPAGTSLQRGDGALYTTDTLGTIAAGEADVPVTAAEGGSAENAAAGETLQLVSPIAGIDSAATVDANGLTGGLDQETPAQLLARLRQRLQNPPAGGAAHDYVRWMLEVAGVTRAWSLPLWLGGGSVGATFVLDGQSPSILPDQDKLDEVEAYLLARTPADLHTLSVFAPVENALDPEIQLIPDTAAIRTAVAAELTAFLLDSTAPGKTVLRSKLSEAISRATGEDDHVLVSPAGNVALQPSEIAVLGTVTWS